MLRCGSKDIPTLPIRPLMLQPSRDPSSKLHELIHARTLEKRLKKRRLPPKTRVGLLQRQRGEVFSDSPERKIEPNRADDSGVLGHTRAMKCVLGPSKAWRPISSRRSVSVAHGGGRRRSPRIEARHTAQVRKLTHEFPSNNVTLMSRLEAVSTCEETHIVEVSLDVLTSSCDDRCRSHGILHNCGAQLDARLFNSRPDPHCGAEIGFLT